MLDEGGALPMGVESGYDLPIAPGVGNWLQMILRGGTPKYTSMGEKGVSNYYIEC